MLSEAELWKSFLHQELLAAVERNDLKDLLSVLEEPDVNLDAKDSEGNTALTRAIQKGYGEAVETLLSAGADTEVRNINGERPLHMAAKSGFPRIARSLLSAGAKVKVRDKQRKTPMDYAKEAGHWDVVDVLRVD